MSTSQKPDTPAASTGNDKPAPNGPGARRTGDPIPPLLLAGIFALVMAVGFVLLKDNWATSWTRYQSGKAMVNKDWDRAIEKLNKLIEEGTRMDSNNPTQHARESAALSPTFLSELGYCYFHKADYETSLEYFLKAQENGANMPPDDSGKPRPPVDFSDMIGLVYFKMDDLDNAEKYLQAALRKNSTNLACQYTMGEVMMKRGEYIKAANYFKTVANEPGYDELVTKYYAEITSKLFANLEQS